MRYEAAALRNCGRIPRLSGSNIRARYVYNGHIARQPSVGDHFNAVNSFDSESPSTYEVVIEGVYKVFHAILIVPSCVLSVPMRGSFQPVDPTLPEVSGCGKALASGLEPRRDVGRRRGLRDAGSNLSSVQKIADSNWDGRYRMFWLPQQSGGNSTTRFLTVNVFNFSGGSHTGGLALDLVSGDRLVKAAN
jgi:hypothetical protein